MNKSSISSWRTQLLVAYIRKHNDVVVEIISDSMRPLLESGDSVVVSRQRKSCFPGDLLLCYRRSLYVHRFILCRGSVYYLKGDNSPCIDRPIRKESIVGVVVQIRKKNGRIQPDYTKVPALLRAVTVFIKHKLLDV